MNGEISLSAFATKLMTAGDQDDETVCPEKIVSGLMNGHATDFVYNTLSLSDRRTHGIFFSGPSWAHKILSGQELSKWQRFIDPSVGIGDLLLEVCKSLPLKESANQTLEDWAERLVAVDLRKSFLDIAWMRIQALAVHRHNTEKAQACDFIFKELPKNFIIGDALSTDLKLRQDDCVVMNPPYQRISAPPYSFVGKGKRSAAALHLEHVLLQAPAGVGIFALIPDVLRSGSSYEKFRKELGKRAVISSFDPSGAFGAQADIDVAILVATSTNQEERVEAPEPDISCGLCVGDFFDISVGPVVPHRTSVTGQMHGYLTAKNATIGSEISSPMEFATYACRLEKGPFVVVRRTSSPTDRKRARSTLVTTREEFLVENHLLILKPKDKKVATCRALLRVLEDQSTDAWLNNQIRCRHLTVGALKMLPWIAD
ncbi:hypothetical protein [Pseudomonas sp. AN-1]|uniref:hypothetical protein n=1 Tax=Pseudomonas sp. AN-1 TaxID=3096605 RepID=UPI002A699F9F|nr:hypothetical protein [Pseudomonas sp. AN-1]WPP46806.1 hypothetical protein SK095_05280 [Pseudomonas sp. AN-1]